MRFISFDEVKADPSVLDGVDVLVNVGFFLPSPKSTAPWQSARMKWSGCSDQLYLS